MFSHWRRWIAEALLKKKYRVRIFDNLSTGFLRNVQALKGDVDFLKGDLRSVASLKKAVRNIDYVFHLAACRAVLRSVDNPLETNEVNVSGTLKLLMASKEAGVKRLVFSSSSSVYGNTSKFPSEENDRPMPDSPYAASKIMGEYYGRLFNQLYGLSTVSLRYFNVFGPRQNPESKYSAVIPIFIDCIVKGQRPEIHWDGKQSRDFSYVDNVVHGNLLAMSKPGIDGEVFNIACHDEQSVLYVLQSIQKILGNQRLKPIFKTKRPGDVRRTFPSIQKARRLLGFKPQTRFLEGLQKTVAWFLEEKK